LELDVGGRRAELAAEFLPMQHPAGDAVGTTEQAFGEGEIRRGQRFAHPGAADPLAVQLNGGGGLDAEAMLGAGLQQKVEVTGTITAEAEIVADLQVADTEAIHQHLLDELRSGQLAQAAIEGQANYPFDPFGSEQLKLVAQPCQARRGSLGTEELAWLRLEDHHT